MKTWMKVVLGIFAGIAVLIGFIFWLTGDVTKAGDDFFVAVQNDDIDAAYELLSEDFKAGTTKEELKSYLSDNALDKVAEVSWGGRMIEGNLGTLNGTIETETGGSIPLTLRLVNSENGWKILSIRKETAGFESGSSETPLPSKEIQTQLVSGSVAKYAQSLADKNMTKFYNHISGTWQQQTSVEELGQIFGSAYQFAPGWSNLTQLQPVLDDAYVERGTEAVFIKAHYPVKPSAVYLEQKYVYEGTGWKLLGFVTQIGSPPED